MSRERERKCRYMSQAVVWPENGRGTLQTTLCCFIDYQQDVSIVLETNEVHLYESENVMVMFRSYYLQRTLIVKREHKGAERSHCVLYLSTLLVASKN